MTGDTLRRGFRLFARTTDEARARRATDVILLAISSIGIILVGLVAIPEPGFSRAVTRFLGDLPEAFDGAWQLLDVLRATDLGIRLVEVAGTESFSLTDR